MNKTFNQLLNFIDLERKYKFLPWNFLTDEKCELYFKNKLKINGYLHFKTILRATLNGNFRSFFQHRKYALINAAKMSVICLFGSSEYSLGRKIQLNYDAMIIQTRRNFLTVEEDKETREMQFHIGENVDSTK